MILKRFEAAERRTHFFRPTVMAGFIAAVLGLSFCVSPVCGQAWDTLHKSSYSLWVTPNYNLAACNTYKNNIDSVATELDKAIPLIVQDLGIAPPEKPQHVQIDSGCGAGCFGGWSSGGVVSCASRRFLLAQTGFPCKALAPACILLRYPKPGVRSRFLR